MSRKLEANKNLIKSMISYFNQCKFNNNCLLCLNNNANILEFKTNENVNCVSCVNMTRVCKAFSEALKTRSELRRELAEYPVVPNRELSWIFKPATWGEVKAMLMFGCVILTLLLMFRS
jgi:hypothetical protein